MKIGEHGFKEHIRLLAPLFGLVAAVWLLRIILSAVGMSPRYFQTASVTWAASLAVLLAALLIHIYGFGSYSSVVLSSFLLAVWGQGLVVLAVLFSVITGLDNVYTKPEFSVPGDDQYHVRHILGHLTSGIGSGTLFGAAAGCFLLWLLRKLVPVRLRH